MLLARKKTILPTKYYLRDCFVWESNSSLLQENRGLEKESICAKIERRTCSWGAQMCAAELRPTQTIMIIYFYLINNFTLSIILPYQ